MSNSKLPVSAEQKRLNAQARQTANWKKWGPYLAERAWGTVREDYSSDGNAWDYFPHEHARSRTYRWNEDGLCGFCDENQYLCFGLALWNGQDPFLKERLFGLTGPEGNHGEDVKELYWYLDSTPTHSFASMQYRYPHGAYPYQQLIDENAARGYQDREFELSDTGILENNKFFDVTTTYAKAGTEDLLIRITIINRSAEAANLSILPQLWFRNIWSWGYDSGPHGNRKNIPSMSVVGNCSIACEHVLYKLRVKGHSSKCIQLRLCKDTKTKPFVGFKPKIDQRERESNAFYQHIQGAGLNNDQRAIQRQALAGMLWSKQLYYYDVQQWLEGDPADTPNRQNDRNADWHHMSNFDVMSMPDKWEYPWYAVWDTAFHCLPLATVDSEYAKSQLQLITRDRYMHPNGQLPAYEWSYGDVNPPVHAWACWNVYTMEKRQKATGRGDLVFLETVFHKLLLNFTWWVNRKDSDGNYIFEGGFLGLDNISLFDRSEEPPTGGVLHQSDGTAWMGFFSACMLRIALELAQSNSVYEELASKFFDHYLRIAHAINGDEKQTGLWDPKDGFFYDRLDFPDGKTSPIKVRSLVGLMPMIAASTIEDDVYREFPNFARRMNRQIEQAPETSSRMASIQTKGVNNRHLLSFLKESRLRQVLTYLLDENEFLSPYGIRSLSKVHQSKPYTYKTRNGKTLCIGYEPGEGETNMFGGNSNWRGPIWFPINYLLIESLRRYYSYYGDSFTIECPTGSGNSKNLDQVAQFIANRLCALFELNTTNKRPWCGNNSDLLAASMEGLHQYFEYFNGDTGEGLGASHQTGWTGLIALLLQPDLEPL